MKKRFLLLLVTCLTAMFLMMVMGIADSENTRVFDEADVLTNSEEQKLQQRIESIQEKYGFDTVIRIADDSTIPNETGEIDAYAESYYLRESTGNYKFGDDCFMIFLNMYDDGQGRGWCLLGSDECDKQLGTYFYEYVTEDTSFYSYLTSGRYYDCFNEALEYYEIFLEQAKTGEPYSKNNPYKKKMSTVKFVVLSLIEAGIALLFGKGYASRLRSSMNTAIKRTEATEYINQSSFNLTNSQDLFMYSNVTRTPIPTETRSGSGGSGGTSYSSHSSGGHSFSSRSGRF